jgi:hypothetical protein
MEVNNKMSEALQKRESSIDASILEKVVIGGDLSVLTPEQRVKYYNALCRSLGLNPLSKPFDYLTIDKKLLLYARKDCTEQLRTNRRVSITELTSEIVGDLLIVTAKAELPDGRTDIDRGVVFLKGVFGDSLCNAYMKAVTKSKRRVTLSICGLGMLDESEIETVQGARVIDSDLTVAHKASGLDQWKCSRSTAMAIIKVCQHLHAAGATEDQVKAKLPANVTSRKDLTEEQGAQLVIDLQALLADLQRAGDVHEGEVVNA